MLSAFYWGTNFENVLNFSYPLYDLLTDREPRAGSDFVQGASALEDSWIVGWDYTAEMLAKYLQLGAASAFPVGPGGSSLPLGGAGSFQAFLDWCRAKNPVRFVPDVLTAPDFFIDGCYLADPVKGGGGRGLTSRLDWTQKMKFRNPVMDFAQALRWQMLEAAGGMDITQPLAGSYVRAGAATYHGRDGILRSVAANVLRSAHWQGSSSPLGLPTGPMILLENGRTNSALQSETFGSATWVKTRTSITADALLSPDGANSTADKIVEDASATTTHTVVQAITITSGESIAVSVYFHPGQRSRLRLQFADGATTNGFRVDFDLIGGTAVNPGNIGAGVLEGKSMEYLANGWVRCSIWGEVNAAVTAAQLFILLADNTGNPTYTGDGSSGLYVWGAQVERCGANIGSAPTSYISTVAATVTRTSDTATAFTFPFAFPMQSMTMYAKIVDLSPATGAITPYGIIQLGDTGFTNPRWYIVKSSNSWSSAIGNESGGSSVAGTGALSASYGDLVEIVAQFDMTNPGAAFVKLFTSTNGGALTVNTGAAILAPLALHLAQASVGPFINDGAFGLLRLKVAAGVRDFATMQAA